MRRRRATIALFALTVLAGSTFCLPVSAAAAAESDPAPITAPVTVNRVDGLSKDFIDGVDVSTVLSLEESGVVFRDDAGQPADLFRVLADHGVNSVRIRVWNDPFDASGRGYGGGDVDPARAVEIGQRAAAAGLSVLVDFHYSDFWADPGRQLAPKAWQGFDAAQTATAIHDFTADTLHRFADAGVHVTMVQIGNETNNGIAGYTRPGLAIDQTFASLLSAGSRAVREVLPDALVAVHFTNPETPGRYATYAAGLAAFGVDYDVFASSYYPYWHGTTQNLTAVLSQIANTYGKKVMVAETSWAHTLDDGDGYPNAISASTITDQYPASVQGQASELRDVIAAVAAVGEAGIGVYYWEPAWLPVGPASDAAANSVLWERDGSGWATSAASGYDPVNVGSSYGGSAWDNQALFDATGRPLASLRTFEYVRTGSLAPRTVVSFEQISRTITAGAALDLPPSVTITYNDATTEQDPVTWAAEAVDTRVPGEYTVTGRTAGGRDVTAAVSVRAVNHVQNPSFESDDMSAWTLTGAAARETTGDASDGGHAVTFWAGSAYTAGIAQHLTGLAAGTYQLQATTQGTNVADADTRTLSATSAAGTWSSRMDFTGWREFHTATVSGIVVGADGALDISAELALSAGAWGVFDDVRLVAVSTGSDEPGTEPGSTPAPVEGPGGGTAGDPGSGAGTGQGGSGAANGHASATAHGALAMTGAAVPIAALAGALALVVAGAGTLVLRRRRA